MNILLEEIKKINNNIQHCVKQCQDIAKHKELFEEKNKELENQIGSKNKIINELTEALHNCQEELENLKVKFNKIME